MRRIRVQATIDRDSVSPDSIRAANEYLTSTAEARAGIEGLALDWNSWRGHVRSKRRVGDLVLTQWVKVLR